MPQDLHQRAKERFEDAKEAASEQHARMREDLLFSDPTDPQQWDEKVKKMRGDRVCLTADRTNQYIFQVVNDARKNKPGITTMPADSGADVQVAQRLDGIIRHIEYRSRAAVAYDTSIDHSARCGLGWIRVVPEIVRPETNQQEVTIKRVHDPLSIVLDPDSTEPDGSDAMFGFAETVMSKRAFERAYPKADVSSWESADAGSAGWFTTDGVRICEYQYVEETQANFVVAVDADGEELELSEDDYWLLAKQIGYQPKVVRQFMATERRVKWCKLNGAEVLEETDFPSRWLGFIPVLGYELWVDGKRKLCGLTRRMMESQRAYNYERSALVEAVALQPKAPTMVPIEAVAGHEKHWRELNTGSPAYLPYNHADDDGNPLPAPQRLAPPAFPAAFAQGGQIALGDLEASVGMYRANLGAPNNATSGRQERERKEEGDTATFHFVDNLSRSIEHVGRIVVDMIPRLYDTKRQARILGVDGKNDQIEVDPQGPAVRKQGNRIVAINPGVGSYDVRVVAGANYTTQRQEAAEGIAEILQAAPNFAPVLAPSLVKLRDWPEADKVSRMLLAMAPPQVQEIANEGQDGDEPALPPAVRTAMEQMQAQMQQMAAMLDAGEKEIERLTQETEALKADKSIEAANVQLKAREIEVKEIEAGTKRIEATKEESQAVEMARIESDAEQKEADRQSRERIELLKLAAQLMGQQRGAEGAEGEGEPAEPTEPAGADLAGLMQSIQSMAATLAAPRILIHDENGHPIGVQPVLN